MSIPNIKPEIGDLSESSVSAEVEIRKAVARALKNCNGKSRGQVTDGLTALSGIRVTKHMLDDWCSPSKGARFPLSLVRALCQITGSDDLAFLAMRDSLREQAKLGARAVELLPLLRNMIEQASALAGRPRAMRSKRSK